jgi:two-component system sensor histidine kinase/response regulator
MVDVTERKKTEEKLLFISKAVDSASDAIGISDAQGHHFYQNKALTDMFGYSTAEEIESFGGGRIVVKDPSVAKEMFVNIMSGKSWSGELEMVTKSGQVFPAYERADAIKDVEGNIIGLIGVVTDITFQKQIEYGLKESEEKYHSLYDSIKDGVLMTDLYGNILECNQSYLDILGYTLDEVKKLTYKQLTPTKWHDFEENIVKSQVLSRGYSNEYEKEYYHKDGKVFPISIRVWLKRDKEGNPDRMWGIVRDITERKKVELIISKQNDELSKLNTDKDRFISILSHDLRSPFNALLGLSEVLKKEVRKLDIDEIENIAIDINTTGQRTYNLLEDILTWARAQQGKIPCEPQNLSFSEICYDIHKTLNLTANAKSISLNYSNADHMTVFADKNMLKTVLRNIVSNAIKFTNSGGAINISAIQTDSDITISVLDNGIGIQPDNITKLFDISEYITTKGTAGETGTGLGLLLCKEFVEKHHGKIWVESEMGKGSDFKFTLPISIEKSMS